jgi:DNA polymerase-3 subunit epsilon
VSEFLLDPSSDEFHNIAETALKNETLLSNVTLYKLWMRLYYSLEKANSSEAILGYTKRTQWAHFVKLLFQNYASNSDNFVSEIRSLASDGFVEGKALNLVFMLRNIIPRKRDVSMLYWDMRDLFDENSVEAAYHLGLIYSDNFNIDGFPKSPVFTKNIPAAESCFEFAITARKREAHRQLGIIQKNRKQFTEAKDNFNLAINAGDTTSSKYLKELQNLIEQDAHPVTLNEQVEDDPPPLLAREEVSIIPRVTSNEVKSICPNRFVVIDFETTGFSPRSGDRIIEIGAVEVLNGKITREYQTLINPSIKISEIIQSVTSITNAMVSKAPTSKTEIPKLLDFISDGILVAHHIEFEIKFLRAECELLGLDNPLYSISTLCTLKRARRLFPTLTSHKLGDLLKRFSIPVNGSLHRALPDARATALLLLMMNEKDPQGLIEHIKKPTF